MSIKYFISVSMIIFLLPVLHGQDRVTEQEINIQKTFIEANREKLLGNFEEASNLFREVLASDAQNGAAAYELARVYDVLDRNKESLEAINIAVTVEPLNSWYQTFRADVFEKSRRYEEAAKVYETLISFFPDQNYYYYKQAFYLVKAQEVNKAIKVYNKLEENIGITEDLTKKKFRLYLASENNKKAEGELQKLVKAYPSSIDYRLELSSFYESIGRNADAEKVYKEILSLDPNNGPASLALAQKKSGTQEGDFISALKPIFQNPETDIDSKVKQLIPYVQQVADDKDLAMAQRLMPLAQLLEEVHPDEAKSFALYGDLLFHSGNEDAALEKYKKAIQLDKGVFNIWEQALYILKNNNQYDELLKMTDQAQNYFPNQSAVLIYRGLAFIGLDNYAQAIPELKQAKLMTRKIPSAQLEILQYLAVANAEMKQWGKAKEHYDEALALNPKDPMLLSNYAASLAASGKDLDKALGLIQEANELSPKNPWVMTNYGRVHLAKGEMTQSREWLEKAERAGGARLAQTNDALGDLYYQEKKYPQAKEYWEKAIQLGGKKSKLEKKIDAL